MNIEKLNDLPALGYGNHDDPTQGACVMEAVSYIAGEEWSDTPECVCPVIGAFLRSWNDGLPNDEERDRLLRPLVGKLIGTRSTVSVERRRAVMSADWYIRVQTPAWLHLAGLSSHAALLESFPEITDFLQCPSIQPTLDAAWSAARSAAWSAAESAAESAAWSAARSALEDTRIALQASALDLVERMIAVKP
jgi:hypothetical protein